MADGSSLIQVRLLALRKYFPLFLILFWYLSLFPGRLAYDTSELIRMIRRGESTDWFTAAFYWFIRISSFDGRQIFIPSLICLLAITFSVKFLIDSFNLNSKLRFQILCISLSMPFVGAFGMNVSHDTLQVAGILLLVSINLRKYHFIESSHSKSRLKLEIIAVILLSTSVPGIVLALVYSITNCLTRSLKSYSLLMLILLSFNALCGINVTKDDSNFKYNTLIGDLKCIAQHPGARVTEAEWAFLIDLAPLAEWKNAVACSTADATWGSLPGLKPEKIGLHKYFLQNYVNIILKNPAIYAEAHLQRSRGAFPPPFFQGPQNQIDSNLSHPVGFGTNTALQAGPEVIHPSIDEESVRLSINLLKPFERFAQIGIFLVNQASWFWGWGGLWLWGVLALSRLMFKGRWFRKMISVFYPIFFLNFMLFFVSPGGYPRYVMSSVIAGFICTIIVFGLIQENGKKNLRGTVNLHCS